MARLKEELSKCRAENNWTANKCLKIDNARAKAEKELQTLRLTLKNTEIEVNTLKRQNDDEKKVTEGVMRERDAAAKNVRTLKETLRRMQQVIDVSEQSRRKIETELEEAMQTLNTSNKRIQVLEKEREKFVQETKELAQQVNSFCNLIRRMPKEKKGDLKSGKIV